ncbi:transcription initiation factor TFIID subunit 11 [Blastocladiella emersonii ATCC 22665]|nr:transcription initiation factor TFIID subunit 11 [Blastocladiella emersonii ATCC 22665]
MPSHGDESNGRPTKRARFAADPVSAADPLGDDDELQGDDVGESSSGPISATVGSMQVPMTMQLIYEADERTVGEFVEKHCTPDQRERFYAFRRIKFNGSHLRRLAIAATGANTITKGVPLVLSAITRTYLSEILDLARAVMREMGDSPTGALGPHHLREGYRRYRARGRGFPPHNYRKRIF